MTYQNINYDFPLSYLSVFLTVVHVRGHVKNRQSYITPPLSRIPWAALGSACPAWTPHVLGGQDKVKISFPFHAAPDVQHLQLHRRLSTHEFKIVLPSSFHQEILLEVANWRMFQRLSWHGGWKLRSAKGPSLLSLAPRRTQAVPHSGQALAVSRSGLLLPNSQERIHLKILKVGNVVLGA